MTTYDNVVRAAKRLSTDDNRNNWELADAVLAEVPVGSHGGDRKSDQVPGTGDLIADRLAALAKRMADDGVTTPDGDSYTVGALTNLREMATTWPVNQRHPEAAYSTHREAGSPKTEGGRVLKALAAVARGETVAKPKGLDADAWKKACDRIQARKKGFPVAANDLNIALKRKSNGTRGGGVTKADVKAAIASGDVTAEDLLDAVADEELDPVIDTLRSRRIRRDNAANTEGMTDEEIEATDKALEAISGISDSINKTADQMEINALGGPACKYAVDGEHYWLTALLFARKGGIRNADEAERMREYIARTRHAVDLIEMICDGVDGADLDDEIQSFLAEHVEQTDPTDQ